MEIKLAIFGDAGRLPEAYLTLSLGAGKVFLEGFKKSRSTEDLTDEDFFSYMADPVDCSLTFDPQEIFLFAKTVIEYYQQGGRFYDWTTSDKKEIDDWMDKFCCQKTAPEASTFKPDKRTTNR